MTAKRAPQEGIGTLGTLGDFWQWAMSDMLNNRNRGILAEYLVGKLLGLAMDEPRIEWDAYDLVYQGRKIEVKSSGYFQTWRHDDKPSRISFGVGKRQGWDASTNIALSTPERSADLYVFCVFPAQPELSSRLSAPDDVLKPELWAFYVARSTQLPDEAQRIGLTRVQAICGAPCDHTTLQAAVDSLLK